MPQKAKNKLGDGFHLKLLKELVEEMIYNDLLEAKKEAINEKQLDKYQKNK